MKALKCMLLLVAAMPALAGAVSVEQLRSDWAHVQYEIPEAGRLDAMSHLKNVADAALAADSNSAGLLIWDAIITSSMAGLKGGLGALSLAKESRAKLEQAEKLQPGALNGSALTSLGALYYQVPGWPIGFGNKDKARASLLAALKIDPDSIDANYFYADFLLSQGDHAGARKAAEHALAAPPRPGREVADNGRRAEARVLIAKLGVHAGG
ncbi:MAG: tetratricopeptide repeat protein [Steroidobacteraceae bacterium]